MNESGVEIKNPRLTSLALDDVTKFIKERESYSIAVKDKNTAVQSSNDYLDSFGYNQHFPSLARIHA